jgi:hypothetical protein
MYKQEGGPKVRLRPFGSQVFLSEAKKLKNPFQKEDCLKQLF